ncbi:MAG: ankyrin repeat domain-containing protein, partial [Acidobacteriota bacterium]|nr:ankyrin repeat domain-containing protein [Acidobacteriota bacterium]
IPDWAARWFETYAARHADVEAGLRGLPVTQPLRESVRLEELDRIEKNIRVSPLARPGAKLADAQFFIARAHGFESWPKFASHFQSVGFEAAADAAISGDVETLRRLLNEDPRLVHTRSHRSHHAPLLHYIAANGVEDFRQKTPPNVLAIARLLLEAGADVNAESDAYGGGCTALSLAATSLHPERAGVQEELLQLLLDHGARIDKPDAVAACLANGRGRAAEFLASRGARLNLETAAGAGRLDVVETFFRPDGSLDPATPPRQVQRGFLWACMYGRQDVVEFLLDHGADLRDPADLGATGLHWAAGAHLNIVRLLLQRGAPLEVTNKWGGTVLEHAVWASVNTASGVDYVPIFQALLAAGARVDDRIAPLLRR